MYRTILTLTWLINLTLVPLSAVHAEEAAMDCRLKGGSVVQLPPAACAMEGGTPLSAAPGPATSASPPVENLSADPGLAAAQKAVIELLDKPVVDNITQRRNPEGLERTATFEGCHMKVDESLHVQYGNLFTSWKDFRIASTVDFGSIGRDAFGLYGNIDSKGGDLKASAVYFMESVRDRNALSISVLGLVDDKYIKYTAHGPVAYWSGPHDELWMADEFGYAKDTGFGTVAKDKVRILYIMNTADDAAKLERALENLYTVCKAQPASN